MSGLEPHAQLASWVGASTVAGAVVAAVDTVVSGCALLTVFYSVGLGAGFGLLFGLPFALSFRILRDGPRWVAAVFWPLVCWTLAVMLAEALGAFGQLGGPHGRLAWAVLGACGAGALFATAAAWGLQPSPQRERGVMGARWSTPAALVAIALAAGLIVADARLFPALYTEAHVAMRLAVFWLATVALWLALPTRRWGWTASLVVLPLLGVDTGHASAMLDTRLAGRALIVMRSATDFDADGYSGWLAGGDCAPFDSDTHPGATEVPGNGVDDNCRLGDATAYDTGQVEPDLPQTPAPTSVVLITVDTMRPDRLSAYGYKRETTPFLMRFAQDALRYDNAYTSGGWTSLAVPSLMRGVYPRRLRWTRMVETTRYRLLRIHELGQKKKLKKGERARRTFTVPLETPRRPLASWLRRRGMHTAAVVDDGYGQFLHPKLGLKQGFDAFHRTDRLEKKRRNDRGTADLAIQAIEALPADRPFFLWVHFFGPHDPSTKHRGLKRFGSTVSDLYDHELRYADRHVGRLLERVAGIDRPVATIITSDHGELFTRGRRYHGIDLHELSIRVPLLVRAPGWPTGVTDRLVSLVDLAPTILALTETPAPYRMDGVDLARPAPKGRILLAETWKFRRTGPARRDLVAGFDGRRKLVYDRRHNRRRLVSQAEMRRPAPDLLQTGAKAPDLEAAVFRYFEETGGALNLRD